jgi:hypothetical protein
MKVLSDDPVIFDMTTKSVKLELYFVFVKRHYYQNFIYTAGQTKVFLMNRSRSKLESMNR